MPQKGISLPCIQIAAKLLGIGFLAILRVANYHRIASFPSCSVRLGTTGPICSRFWSEKILPFRRLVRVLAAPPQHLPSARTFQLKVSSSK